MTALMVALAALVLSGATAAAADQTAAQKCAADGHPVLSAGAPRSAGSQRRAEAAGWAFLDGARPLVGARVRVVAGGRTIRALRGSSTRTGADGTFLIAIRRLPTRAQLVVTGGRVHGRPFHGVLRAALRDHATGATVYVDPASTLAAAYLARFPKRTPTRAGAAVRRFLGIAPWASLGSDLQTSTALFSGRRFLSEAGGHVDRFLATLARAMIAGRRHPFTPGSTGVGAAPGVGESGAGAVAKKLAGWLGSELASGAVSYLGGLGMGWVLSQFGVEDGISGQIAELSSKLDEINQRLAALGDQVQQLIVQSNKQYLVTVAKDLDNARSEIKSRMSDLLWIADMGHQTPKPDPSYLEQQACAKLKSLRSLAEGTGGYGYAETKIAGSFFPEGTGSDSITQAAASVVRDKYKWWTGASAAEVRQLVDYWISVQASWLTLKLEWEHATAPCPSSPSPTTGNCEALRWSATFLSDADAESDTLPPDEPRSTWIDRSTGLMWSPTEDHHDFEHPPPATFFDTFGPFDREDNLFPTRCSNYELTLCAIEGVDRASELFGAFKNWAAPTEAQIAKLIDGWQATAGSPLAYLTAAGPTNPGASAAWLKLGGDKIWTRTCRIESYNNCVLYNLDDGSHPIVPTQTTQGPGEKAGFLLVRDNPDASRYWTARSSNDAVRYVSTSGSDSSNDCTTYTRPCKTLAHALDVAHAGDTIRLAGGTFTGGVTVSKSLAIDGLGPGLTRISGGGPVVGIAPSATVTIDDVSITDGLVSDGKRLIGGIGGGIENGGTLTLSDSAVTNNTASDGGGIRNAPGGRLRVLRSTVSANTGFLAGGIENAGGTQRAELAIVDSTITGNVGGAVVNFGGGPVALDNVTVTANKPSTGNVEGALRGSGFTLINTVVAQNPGLADCWGGTRAGKQGHDLIGAVGIDCAFDAAGSTGNQLGTLATPVDAKLGTLAHNGGPTPTVKPQAGSPVLGAGDKTACTDPATVDGIDQRGYRRPKDGCDIGALDTKATNPVPDS